MSVQQHSIALTVAGGITLDVESATQTLDEAWSPYGRATFQCALPAAFDSIDPRNPIRLNLLTTLVYVDEGRPTQTVASEFVLRSRDIDHANSKMTLTASTKEALLQDYAYTATTPRTPTTTALRTHVEQVLAIAVPGAALESDAGATGSVAATAVWVPGTSAWDYLSPLVLQAGLRLWADLAGKWHLTERSPAASGSVQLSYLYTITEANEVVTRDGDWGDAVVVVYKWNDTNGAPQTAYDVATVAGFSKVKTYTYDVPKPGVGAATNLLARMRGRGRQQTVAAISDYTVVPGMACMLTVPGTVTQTGFVASVAWAWPTDEMTVTTRELVDTPPTAWVFDPAGVSWNSLAVGIDWSEDI